MNHELLTLAREAAKRAYCPHSKFHVGAAVHTDKGVFVGCNIENDSYGLTICAERCAIFIAVAAGSHSILDLAVTCPDAPDGCPPSGRMPCGACRQVIQQFSDDRTRIYVDQVGKFSIDELLPEGFRL